MKLPPVSIFDTVCSVGKIEVSNLIFIGCLVTIVGNWTYKYHGNGESINGKSQVLVYGS